MKSIAIFCLLLTFKMGAQDWVPLYNGIDLQGWEQLGEVDYEIEDGVLYLKGGQGLLWCKARELGNVTLRVIYSGAKKNNPGILLRIPQVPTEAWMAASRSYEIKLDDKNVKRNSKNNKYKSRGKGKKDDESEWDVLEITLNGYQTIIKMNDVIMADYTDGNPVRSKKVKKDSGGEGNMPEYGFLGIQNRGKEDEIGIKEISYLDLSR